MFLIRYEDGDVSPFFRGTAEDYTEIYSQTYIAVKKKFGNDTAQVRLGLAMGANEFSSEVLQRLEVKRQEAQVQNSNNNQDQVALDIDFIDVHVYSDVPNTLPYRVYGKPMTATAGNYEGMLARYGFLSSTPISFGEWSRSIPRYATDGPGAAFLACGLMYMNQMTKGNSNGAHNVEGGFVYSAQKVWDGVTGLDLNAAVVWNMWGGMVADTPVMLETTGDVGIQDQLCAVAGMSIATQGAASTAHDGSSVVVFYGHYKQSMQKGKGEKETTLPKSVVTVELKNIPWSTWTWSQQDNTEPAMLVEAAAGSGAGSDATLTLMVHGNSLGKLVLLNAADGACNQDVCGSSIPDGFRQRGNRVYPDE